MDKKFRVIILILGIFIFLVLAPIIALYTQGIRIDFEKKTLVKTGGIFIESLTDNVDIYLNGKYKKTTNFFSGNGLLIDNLLPKRYLVEVKKDGFFGWKKELEVMEKNVTEAKNLVLFKNNPLFEAIDDNIEDFFLSSNGKFLLTQKNNGEDFSFELTDIASKKITILPTEIVKKMIKNTAIYKIEYWDEEQKTIIISQNTGLLPELFIFNYEFFPKIELTTTTLSYKTDNIALDPADKNKIIYISNAKLYQQPLKNNGAKPTSLKSNINWFETEDNKIFYLSDSGLLIGLNPDGKEEVINKKPVRLANSQNIFKIKKFQGGFLLSINGNIYFLNSNSEFEKIIPDKKWVTSPDDRKLALLGSQEIWLLEKENEKEKMTFLNRFWKTPGFLYWLNENYLIFNIGGEIKISEVDTRDSLNIITVNSPNSQKIFFSQFDKKLYLLSDKTLITSERLLP